MKFRPQPKKTRLRRKRIPPKTMQIKFNGKRITIFRFGYFPFCPLCRSFMARSKTNMYKPNLTLCINNVVYCNKLRQLPGAEGLAYDTSETSPQSTYFFLIVK